MPELTSKKVMPTINTFDFDFFADNKGKRNAAQKVAIITTNSYISKSRSVIKRLRELGIPKIVEGRLVDDELLFKF